jgi:serine O-acetyltransferase
LIIRKLNIESLVIMDTDNFKYYINATDESFFICLNRLLLRNKCYRNVVHYRISQKSTFFYLFARLLYPQKDDLEISGEIDGGLLIFHGHGTVISLKKAGQNLKVYQGVTIGKKEIRGGKEDVQPTIGNNVTIYTGAIVIGGISIGDNVKIGAGTIVMKDIPSNSLVVGNPCVIKKYTR